MEKKGFFLVLVVVLFVGAFAVGAGAQENNRSKHHSSHGAAHPAAHPMHGSFPPHAMPPSHAAGHSPVTFGHGHPHPHPHISSGFRYYVHPPSNPPSTRAMPEPPKTYRFNFHHHHNSAWSPAYVSSNNGYQFYPYTYYNPTGYLSPQYQTYTMNDRGTYYYDQGTFYQDQGDTQGYSAVTPPMGMVISSLPSGVNASRIDGQRYYIYNGVYYQKVAGGFKVVESPMLGHYYGERRR